MNNRYDDHFDHYVVEDDPADRLLREIVGLRMSTTGGTVSEAVRYTRQVTGRTEAEIRRAID